MRHSDIVRSDEFWTIVLMVYCSDDTMFFGTNSNIKCVYLGYIVMVCLFIYWVYQTIVKQCMFTRPLITVSVGACIICLLSMIINRDWYFTKFIYNIFILLFSMLLVANIGIDIFKRCLVQVVYICALSSVIIWCVSVLQPSVIRLFPVITNTSGNEYYFLGIGLVQNNVIDLGMRCYGIFREPGVFMIYLVIALMFEMFTFHVVSNWKVMTIVFALMVTLSSAAYILLGIIMLMYIITGKHSARTRIKLVLVSILLFVVMCSVYKDIDAVTNVYTKMIIDNASRYSRTMSVVTNLRYIVSSPVIGVGWSNVSFNKLLTFEGDDRYNYHNTNTVLKIGAIYGIPYALFLVMYTFRFWKTVNGNKYICILMSIIWFAAISNEDLSFNFMTTIIALYGANHLYRISYSS